MAQVFRPDGKTEDRPRWTVGLFFDEELRCVQSALVCMRGRHAGAPLEIRHARTDSTPFEVARAFDALAFPEGERPLNAYLNDWAALRRELAELCEATVADLLAEARMATGEVLALGVHAPGLWSDETTATSERGTSSYFPLLDLPLVAERTGMNTIGAFPARDKARAGRGGSLMPLVEWILLKAAARNRLLVDAGRTVRVTFLPKASVGNPRNRIVALDVAPGASLWEPFVADHDDANPRDASAAKEWLDAWLDVFVPPKAAPNWSPHGAAVAPYQEAVRSLTSEADRWSPHEIAQTGVEFIARAVLKTVETTFANGTDFEVEEILVLDDSPDRLPKAISELAPGIRLTAWNAQGAMATAFRATCVALLTFLHLDQVPSNLPLVTGADVARVLGELSPGSPQSWQCLLEEFTGERPTIRPLRGAL